MALVDPKDFAQAAQLDKIGMSRLSTAIMNVLKISDINDLYRELAEKEGSDFIDELFKKIHVEFDYYPEELERIPNDGPFVTISNHPLGGVDGIILIKLITLVRPDYKVMVNFLLEKVEPLKPYFMAVNPFENVEKSSMPGIKEALKHIQEGRPLGMFPAGEVSTYKFEERKIIDKPWQEGAIKLIQKLDVPVVPVFFKAKNSFWFYILSAIHPNLRTAKLPSEVFKQRNKSIKIRIGKPILPKEWAEMQSTAEVSQFLRKRTYMLANTLPPERKGIKRPTIRFVSRKKFDQPQPIAEAANPDKIAAEIDYLRQKSNRILQLKNYEIFLAQARDIPVCMHEIGRLREITFREVGEGTNQGLDLDEFDKNYHHLFLWDADAKAICGAYRLGMGNYIYPRYGLEGFYVPTLFKIDKEAEKLFSQGIEMGRAFVIKAYQQKPMPLFLLWKGIVHVLLRNPDLRYINGCVSISNDFSSFSKGIMIAFVKKFYYDNEMAKYIHPRREFKMKIEQKDLDFVLDTTREDLNKLDRFIEDLEPKKMRLPVLLKKYIKQNARIVAFNVDPKFNNCLDGFMYIDIKDLPQQTINPVLEEMEQQLREVKQ